jgi:hypothetical protein
MKKVLILTGSDSNMHNVLDLTLPSKEKYAQKHGYDFIVKRSFDEEITKYGLGLGFARAIMAFNYLEKYDIVMWVDGDSIITNDSFNIEQFIDDSHCFYASYDWLCNKNSRFNRYSFSTGNFIIKKDENTSKLFDSFLHYAQNVFKYEVMAEQGTLNFIYENTELRNLFLILDHKYLGAVPTCVGKVNNWNNHPERFGDDATYPIEYPWNSECFLAHLTGCSNEGRIQLLINDFAEYL